MERLEESLGRLLLEKESWVNSGEGGDAQNCCVTFTDAGDDIERMISRSGKNCCVHFTSGGANMGEYRRQREKFMRAVLILIVLALMVIGIVAVAKEKGAD